MRGLTPDSAQRVACAIPLDEERGRMCDICKIYSPLDTPTTASGGVIFSPQKA
jgi:hypothetical protein